jgi:DNA-binding transcriptional ArsR family regulator
LVPAALKLRDKRKPGHCWQDNELYDCFQPVIGPLAVGVYVRLTRECYGAAVQISLRDLASLTGISKSAVGRAMVVLERIGMVVVHRGSTKRIPAYALADLKELAVHYGATFDPRRSSYVFPAEVCQRLHRQVADISTESPYFHNGVPDGDTELHAGVPRQRVGVPPQGQSCPRNAGKCDAPTSIKKSRNKKTTPLPPFEGGEAKPSPQEIQPEAALRAAWDGVLKDLHSALVNPSLPPQVAARLLGEQDWKRYFDPLAFAGVARAPGDTPAPALALRAPDAALARAGMAKYSRRIDLAMQKYFGRSMPIVLLDTG